jgi:hypothetical protein
MNIVIKSNNVMPIESYTTDSLPDVGSEVKFVFNTDLNRPIYGIDNKWYTFSDNAEIPNVEVPKVEVPKAEFVYTSTYGKDTASWSEYNGNIIINGGNDQTANVFYNSPIFKTGDTISVDITGTKNSYLTVSTTNRGPNTDGHHGVRFNWEADGSFRALTYKNGSTTQTIKFDSSLSSTTGPTTLYITREADDEFSFAFASEGGTKEQLLSETGKQKFTVSELGSDDLYVGFETYDIGYRSFNNLHSDDMGHITNHEIVPVVSSYVYTSTHGEDTASWSEYNGTIKINGGHNQTANVFYNSPIFKTGDTISVDITGTKNSYLTVSTTNRGPNTDGHHGVRFNWKTNGSFKALTYANGEKTNTIEFHSSLSSSTGSVTLHITRESDNTFSFAFDSGGEITELNTTGNTEKQIFTISELNSEDLYVGFETFDTGIRLFNNLRSSHNGPITNHEIVDSSYVYTSTFGVDTASWSEYNGNIIISGGNNQTANVFYNSPIFKTGDTISVDITGTKDSYLTLSTTNRNPDIDNHHGVRFNWKPDGSLKALTYINGEKTNTIEFGGSSLTGSITLQITREPDNIFSFAFGSVNGTITELTEKLTISELRSEDDLYVGFETYGTGTRSFNNLRSTNMGHIGVVGSFNIAAVADPQYADMPTGRRGGGREPEEGVNRLNVAVKEWNKRTTLDWGVIVGDVIDFDNIKYFDTNTPYTDKNQWPDENNIDENMDNHWSNTNAILEEWEKRIVIGNHEYYIPDELEIDGKPVSKPDSVYKKFLGKEATVGYYHYHYEGFRFIVLDGDNSYVNFVHGTQEHTKALAYYNDMAGNAKQWWNAGISITQRLWLMDILDESHRMNEPVIVMCHYPIHSIDDNHALLNSKELQNIIGGYSNVVMWLNGHNHKGDYAYKKVENRHHVGLKGMQNDGDSWYQMNFTPTNVIVYKATDTETPVYDLDITRTTPSIPTPSGFSITDDETLSWNTVPTNATKIIIERRHLSTLIYELPSTAKTLSWKNVATIDNTTTQSYTLTDTSHVIENYKYRIRFGNASNGVSKYAMI